MSVGERIGKLIESKQVTPYQIYLATGINQSTLSRILRGKTKKPQTEVLKLLAEYLQTTPEYLQTGDEEKMSIESNILFNESDVMRKVFEMIKKGEIYPAHQVQKLEEAIKEKDELIAKLREKLVLIDAELQRLGGETHYQNPGEQEIPKRGAG